jgi:PBP1b-binding outer membrane lipoprotein LpoB
MKKIFLILILSLFFISCTKETSYVAEDDYVMFAATYNTTKQEIRHVASKMKPYNVNMIIDKKESEFKENGKIKVLKLKIAYNEVSGNQVRRDTLSFKVKRMGLLFRNYGFKIRYDRTRGATFASVGPVN